MVAAIKGEIDELDIYWCHDPTLRNNYGHTVAMMLADRRRYFYIPERW